MPQGATRGCFSVCGLSKQGGGIKELVNVKTEHYHLSGDTLQCWPAHSRGFVTVNKRTVSNVGWNHIWIDQVELTL